MSNNGNDNKLELIIRDSGLDVQSPKAKALLEQFADYFEIAADWENRAKSIIVTDVGQAAEMKLAREGRLFLREKRIAIEKKRKELKEQSLREGKAIDGMANILKALIVPIEEYLERQECFIEIKAAEIANQLRLDAERKAEAERITKEKAEAEERERIRLENEQLKKEAEQKEKALHAERQKAEAQRRKQQAELDRQKADAERKQREAEESKRREIAKLEAARQAEQDRAEADRLKAEQERRALEARLRTLITCPYCGGKLYPDGSKGDVL
jgi:hypothetical protein